MSLSVVSTSAPVAALWPRQAQHSPAAGHQRPGVLSTKDDTFGATGGGSQGSQYPQGPMPSDPFYGD
ncbi:unnamed protein product [Parascedosporium putredinis]|uniref:Uncharacterized protein n=1 Tax=Parascedosporium putredinis TaxID=1442378 RepID=A0A9P1HBW2_9PEZI|nr:unnamed protein product [Parascedosporium putredinis]CAI8003171.1 unnamed protein product [Parascedosporium putredinis]